MAKQKPAADDAATASGDALALVETPAIDAAPIATPENTPVPGGGRWAWDYSAACWVDKDAPTLVATHTALPPEGAVPPWGGPAAELDAAAAPAANPTQPE